MGTILGSAVHQQVWSASVGPHLKAAPQLVQILSLIMVQFSVYQLIPEYEPYIGTQKHNAGSLNTL